jgi:hypothetical protein
LGRRPSAGKAPKSRGAVEHLVERYKNRSGDSGVTAYQLGRDSLLVQFKNGTIYSYTYASAGRKNIEHMKRLAVAGQGLSTFISQHVSHRYAAKLA